MRMLLSLHPTTSILRIFLLLTVVAAIVHLVLSNACNVNDSSRVDCGWSGINQAQCQTRNCCWNTSTNSDSPWCFFDTVIASKLRTASACEHEHPVSLQCNENETIRIHDVFYGRNNGDKSCHLATSITCFNPNATEIVRIICKNYSTCSVSPKGSIWNFNATCDVLNAQLIVHYICISRGHTVDTRSTGLKGFVTLESSPMIFKTSVIPFSTPGISLVIPSTVTKAESSRSISHTSISTPVHNCACPDATALSLEIERKNNIIIGLSIVLSFLALVALAWAALLCRANGWYLFKEDKRCDGELQMETVNSPATEDKHNHTNKTYDLENENPYYGGST